MNTIDVFYKEKPSEIIRLSDGIELVCNNKILMNVNSAYPYFFTSTEDFMSFLKAKRLDRRGLFRIPYRDIFFADNFNKLEGDVGVLITDEYIYSTSTLTYLGNMYVGESLMRFTDMPAYQLENNGIALNINSDRAVFTEFGKEIVNISFGKADALLKLNIYLPLIITMREGDKIERIVETRLYYNENNV